jgi:hypothetical protein
MAVDLMVRPGEWNEWSGIWFLIRPDPLTSGSHCRVTLHADPLLIHVDAPNGGVHVQTEPPYSTDEEHP